MSLVSNSPIRIAIITGLIAGFGYIFEGRASEDEITVTIGTGQVGGLYYAVGGAICKLINENRGEHGISCTVEITDGSIVNLKDLRDGDFDLVIAQSDLQYDAIKGNEPFQQEGEFEDLRSVFAIYIEHLSVLAHEDRDIEIFEDLKGKRVYPGRPASGGHHTLGVLMGAYGWASDDVTHVSTFEASKNPVEALCNREIDALVYTIGHPNPMDTQGTTACDAVFIPLTGPIIDRLIEENPYYVASVIPGGTYMGNPEDVPSFALAATLLTTTKVTPEVIYQITKVFFKNLPRLRQVSPVFSFLSEQQMVEISLTAPLHEGALKYFSEAGLR